MNKNTEKLNLQ
uniref:Uncharacterized protein n=1 Tax=Arundo donax TaxID=35708 RepID=A0A0A8ZV07_ARUDO